MSGWSCNLRNYRHMSEEITEEMRWILMYSCSLAFFQNLRLSNTGIVHVTRFEERGNYGSKPAGAGHLQVRRLEN